MRPIYILREMKAIQSLCRVKECKILHDSTLQAIVITCECSRCVCAYARTEITLCFRMTGMLVNVSMCVYCLAEITFFSPVYISGFANTSISVSTCGKIPWLWSYFTGFVMTCKRCFFQLASKKSLVNLEPLYSISPYALLSHQETYRVNIISHGLSEIRCHPLYYRQFVLRKWSMRMIAAI